MLSSSPNSSSPSQRRFWLRPQYQGAGTLFYPDEGEGQFLCRLALPDIGCDEGDGQT